MDVFLDDDIVDAAPAGHEALHDREYRVRAYRTPSGSLLLRGAVRDQKPAGLYVPGDPEPLTVHHMQVDMSVGFPSLEITAVSVGFETHPHATCPTITEHYGKLVGLSIGRGYTQKVRDLFGGPRGCTHVTALLNAMAPVAVQCFWSMEMSQATRRDRRAAATVPGPDRQAAREAARALNVNTCHVWREDGEMIASLAAGAPYEAPIFLRRRLAELGRDPDEWQAMVSRTDT